jgi:hypothetical protein
MARHDEPGIPQFRFGVHGRGSVGIHDFSLTVEKSVFLSNHSAFSAENQEKQIYNIIRA